MQLNTMHRPRAIQWVLFFVFVLPELLAGPFSKSISGASASSTYNFIANQRPRFKIPRGNLSYYR